MAYRFAKFGLTGLVNTLVGYAVIVGCLLVGFGSYTANASGYLVGFVVSFLLNRYFTFGKSGPISPIEIRRFFLAAAAAYSVNIAVLFAGQKLLGEGNLLPQLFAVMAYALSFYALSSIFVFSDRH